MEIKTHEDLRNALIEVMWYADDTPTKFNQNMTKEFFWNRLLQSTFGNDTKNVSETVLNSFYSEFPKHLFNDPK